MDTLERSSPRAPAAGRFALGGFAAVVLGFTLMTLGILEVGGVLNIGFGLLASIAGCALMFAHEGTPEDAVETFRRQLEDL